MSEASGIDDAKQDHDARGLGDWSDAGIDSDSDETVRGGELTDGQWCGRSDSAVSSRQTSLASSMTEKTAGWCNSQAGSKWSEPEPEPESDIRQNYRRASSLKTSRAENGPSSHQKKAVRFADALGLDLTAVRQLLDVDFPRPPSWCARNDVITRKVLRPVFEQPCSRFGATFREQVLSRTVLLENLLVNELTLVGSVRVANVAFHKRVFVRYTTDCWVHFADKEATYVALSCDGVTDRFSFTVTAPADIHDYGLAEFCICFVANGEQFWDSNNGRNYICEVVTEELGAPYGSEFE